MIDSGEELWVKIPNAPERYEISNKGRFRVWYQYKGHDYCPHCEILRKDGNNVHLGRKKYNTHKLVQQLFGVSFYDDRPGEIWVNVNGFEDLYQVSNQGRVKSKSNQVLRKDGRTQFNRERIIKFCRINSGYERVILHKDKVTKSFLVHRLVAEHYLPNPEGYEEVNHKNEIKTDNRVENLEWCDKVYNSRYGTCQARRIETRLRNNGGKYGVPRKNTWRADIKK